MTKVSLVQNGSIQVEKLRAEFPVLARKVHGKRLVYLDTGATALKPMRVINAMDRYYREGTANIHRGVHLLSEEATGLYEATRQEIKSFVGAADEREIVFTSGTTGGINLVARSFVKPRLNSGDEVLITTLEHHANIVPWQMICEEQKRLTGVAVDAVFDSVSLGTTHQEELAAAGVVFCSLTEAIQKYPDLVSKYLGSVVPYKDNYYAALNSAVFTDGSFVYVPKGVRCPLDLSTYFRINARETGQFERTLIIADEGSYVSYLEGCTAPMRDENQLHAAVVELIALAGAEIKYSTVQNWYAGDKEGRGGIYNFVTKRGLCAGYKSKISWTQVETGSAITWKYPSVVLKGDDSVGEFYSVALTNHRMQADTGTKMIHMGRGTSSRIISKGISCDESRNTYRGQVKILPSAEGARNFSQCDSMLVGDRCTANTHPYIEVRNKTAVVEHEATTSKISEDQIFYIKSRGVDDEGAVSLILHGFCKDVFKTLPLEFSVEAVKLLEMKLEGSVG